MAAPETEQESRKKLLGGEKMDKFSARLCIVVSGGCSVCVLILIETRHQHTNSITKH